MDGLMVCTQQDTEEFMTFVLYKLYGPHPIVLHQKIFENNKTTLIHSTDKIDPPTTMLSLSIKDFSEKLLGHNIQNLCRNKEKISCLKKMLGKNLHCKHLLHYSLFNLNVSIIQQVQVLEDKITCPLQGLQILQEALPTGSTSPNYDLQAFVHQSGSLGGGHYIAYVYRTRNGEAAWWCYNDTSVTKKTKEEVKNAAKTGYV